MILLLILHIGDCSTQTVDMLETNHVYSSKGDHCFTQVIAWNYFQEDGKLHRVGWRIVRFRYDWPIKSGGQWMVLGNRGFVVSKRHMERHLMFDIEAEDKKEFWGESAPNVFESIEVESYRVRVMK
jgi:hypothetical protein